MGREQWVKNGPRQGNGEIKTVVEEGERINRWNHWQTPVFKRSTSDND